MNLQRLCIENIGNLEEKISSTTRRVQNIFSKSLKINHLQKSSKRKFIFII